MSGVPEHQPALRKTRARVAVDLRRADLVRAVAVDKQGELVAWGVEPVAATEGPTARVEAARAVVKVLGVRVSKIYLLLTSPEFDFAIYDGAAALNAESACELLRRDGVVGLTEPVALTWRELPGAGLVFGGADRVLQPLHEGFDALIPEGVVVCPDLLLLWELCAEGAALLEALDGQLNVVARSAEAPFLRRLPLPAGHAAPEVGLVPEGIPVVRLAETELPNVAGKPLPPAFALPWRLALFASPPQLESPSGTSRRTSMKNASRLGLVGGLLLVVGFALGSSGFEALNRARQQRAVANRQSVPLLPLLQDSRRLTRLQSENAARASRLLDSTPAEPRLGELLYNLSAALPAGVGWAEVSVKEGRLSVDVVAREGGLLEQYRRQLAQRPELRDLGWDALSHDDDRGLWSQRLYGNIKRDL